MNKVHKKTVFSSTPLWQGVYVLSTDMESTQQDLFGPFLSRASANNIVTAQVSGNFFKLSLKTTSKPNEFPKLLPRQLKVLQWHTAVQRSPSQGVYNCMAERVTVWEDKTCLYASRFLYSFPNHQRQLSAVADKKEVKLLKN